MHTLGVCCGYTQTLTTVVTERNKDMEHILKSSRFSSINLETMQPSKNLYELDISLWVLYRSIAQANTAQAAKHLGVSKSAAKELSLACDSRLPRLGSGILLSFSLKADKNEALGYIENARINSNCQLPSLLSPNSQLSYRLENILYERYWRVMRDLSVLEGIKTAALAFGVDPDITAQVAELSDGELSRLSKSCTMRFQLRFNGETLSQLLLRENIAHHSLLRYQQALSSTVTHLNKPGRSTVYAVEAELEDQPKPATLKSYSPNWIKAKHLASIGFIARALQIETGISQKQVVRLRGEIRDEGIELPSASAKLRSGSLIRDYISSIQASLIMLCYHKYGGKNAGQNINIDALVSAFILYHKVRNEIGMNPHRWKIIDPNAGYSLARELRGDGIDTQAYFENCDTCDASIFISTNQLINHDERCPFCRIKDAEKIKAA